MNSLNSTKSNEKEEVLNNNINTNEGTSQILNATKSLRKFQTKDKLISSLIITLKKPFRLNHRKKIKKHGNTTVTQLQTQISGGIDHPTSHIIVNDSSVLSLHRNISKSSDFQSNSNDFIVDLQSEVNTTENKKIKPKLSLELEKKKSNKKENKKFKKINSIYKKLNVKRIFKKKKTEVYSSFDITNKSVPIYPINNKKNGSLKVEITDGISTDNENIKPEKESNVIIKLNDNDYQSSTISNIKTNKFSLQDKSNVKSVEEISVPYAVVGSYHTMNEMENFNEESSNNNFNEIQSSCINDNKNKIFSFSNISGVPLVSGLEPTESIKSHKDDSQQNLQANDHELVKFDLIINETDVNNNVANDIKKEKENTITNQVKLNFDQSLKIPQPSFIIKTSTPQILQEVTPNNISIDNKDASHYNQEITNDGKQDSLLVENQLNPMVSSTSDEYIEDEIKMYCGLPDKSLDSCQAVIEKVSQYFADNIACFWSIFPMNEPHQRMGNWKLGEFLDRWFRSNYEGCVREISAMISTPDQFLIERLIKFQLKSCSWTAHNNYLQYTLIRLCMEKEDTQHINLLLRYFIVPPHLWSRVSYFIAELLDFASGIYPDYDIIVSELTDSYDLVHRMNPVQLCLTAIYMGTTIVPKRKRPSIYRNTINDDLYDHDYILLELMVCLVIENCMKKFCQTEMIKYLMNQYAPILTSIIDSQMNGYSLGLFSLNNEYSTNYTNKNALKFNSNLNNNINDNGINDNGNNDKNDKNIIDNNNIDNNNDNNNITNNINSNINNTINYSNNFSNLYNFNPIHNYSYINHIFKYNASSDVNSYSTRPSFSNEQMEKEFNYEMIPCPPYYEYSQSISTTSLTKTTTQKDINKKYTEDVEIISASEDLNIPNEFYQRIKPFPLQEINPNNYTSFNKSNFPEMEKDPLDILKEDGMNSTNTQQDNIIITSASATMERIMNDGVIEEININDKLKKNNKGNTINTNCQNDVNDYKIKDKNKAIDNSYLLSNTLTTTNNKEDNSKLASEEYRHELIELDKLTQLNQSNLHIDQPLETKESDHKLSIINDNNNNISKTSIKMIPSQSLIKDKKENNQLEIINPSSNPNIQYKNFDELNLEYNTLNNKALQNSMENALLKNGTKKEKKVKGEEIKNDENINNNDYCNERHSFKVRNSQSISSKHSQLKRSSTKSISTFNSSNLLSESYYSRYTLSKIDSMDSINHYLYGSCNSGELYEDMEECNYESDYNRKINYTDLDIRRNSSEGLSVFDISNHCPSFYSYNIKKGKAPVLSTISMSSSSSSSSSYDNIYNNNNDDESDHQNYSFISILSSKPSLSKKSYKDSSNSKVVFHEMPSTSDAQKSRRELIDSAFDVNGINNNSSSFIKVSQTQDPSHLIINDSKNQFYSNDFSKKCIPSASNVIDESQLNLNENGKLIDDNINTNAINNKNYNNNNNNDKNHTTIEGSSINNINIINNNINNNILTLSSFKKLNFDLNTNPNKFNDISNTINSQASIINILRSNLDINIQIRNEALLNSIEKVNPNLDEKVVKALELVDYYQHGKSIDDYYENYTIVHLNELEELLKYFHIFDMKQIQRDIMNWIDLLLSRE